MSAFVMLLLVAVVVLMGMVVDGGDAMAARQAAIDEAEQAARAGAGALSVTALRSGSITIDKQSAIDAAVAYTVRSGHPGAATVVGGVVTVHVSYDVPTEILGMVGIPSIPVSATASAVDVTGSATSK